MNSYPPQFLAHPQPLMFVAGLTPSRDRSNSTTAQTPGSSSRRGSGSRSRRPSDAGPSAPSGSASGPGSTFLDPSQSTSLNSITPITSPSLGQKHAELPRSPPPLTSPPVSATVLTVPVPGNQGEQDEKDRDFDKLVSDLRGALEAKSGSGRVWIPEAERKDFRIMLVDKNIRLPARKVAPTTTSSQHEQSPPSHSPLSPLTTSSPTYPDGLITPMWIRKHSEYTPAVFVLFLRLWECPDPTSITPEELETKEREMDDALVREIGDRRRRLGERGIKLTVVLMASAAALDSPVLDPRLSYLRRASSLSAKASLFVLTPVPADQLPDFVQSLQDALYDSAMEYYAAHGKKVRRKRVRLPSASSGAMLGIPGKTLGSQGWAVRYDWKAGWFAELRGDMVEARRHYEDCWNELAKMFGSTQTLPPRTKRWAEAKVLADCVAIRICRLLLYSSEATKVLTPFHVHLKRFGDLSRGWGIGEETFEFWSSLARQYRIFAELLEMAQQDNLRIPLLTPPLLPTSAPPGVQMPTLEYFATPISSMNPLQILQQPAYYYYAAADCTIQRKKRFDEAVALEEDAKDSQAGGHIAMAPGFANEKKVDHHELAIELFTKAYQLLKEESLGHTRVALLVAFRIAETYCSSSQHELAMRFFDRISHTFQQDRWSPIVRQIRTLWYKSAQHAGNVETAARLLLEMMSPKSGVEGEERAGLQDDFLSLLKTTQPSSSEPTTITMDQDSAILIATTAFWSSEADLGGKVPFQISLSCDETVDISQLRFSSVEIAFSDDRPDCVLKISENGVGETEPFIDLGLVGEDEVARSTSALLWGRGNRVVLNGQLQSDQEGEIGIESIKLVITQTTWSFHLSFPLQSQSCWYTPSGTMTPVRELVSVVNFVPRTIDVKLDNTSEIGYVGEQVPVIIKIRNDDDRKVYLRLSVFLPPGEEEQDLAAKYEDQETTSLLQDISLGYLEPSSTIEKKIHIEALYPGTKLIDLSLQVSLDEDVETGRVEEINHTVELVIEDPFEISSSVMYRHCSRAAEGDGVEGWASVMSLLSVSGRGMEVVSIDIEPKTDTVKLVTSSLVQQESTFPQDWTNSTVYSIASKFAICPNRRASTAILGPSTDPSAYITTKWRSTLTSDVTTTHLPLPTLSLPPQDSFITAHLLPPPTSRLNTPTPLRLSISNSHPSATATELAISIDPSENFIWQGPKSVHVPPLNPGSDWECELEVVPTGQVGFVELPKVRLWEGVGEEREELDIVVLSEKGQKVEIGGASIQVWP